MANRRLKRMGLSKDCAEALERANIDCVKDLMNKNRQELVSLLGLHAKVCDDLLTTVAANICPAPRSVTECMLAKQQVVSILPTGMVSFDATLRGGLPCGGITEVVGPAGAGKTQFCLQSCVRAIGEYEHDSAIYVDTESRFSADRLFEISNNLFPNLSIQRRHKMAERCIVYTVQSTEELTKTLSQLQEVIIEKNVKLVVVDSVASLVRHEFNSSALASRQEELIKEAQTLKYLGENFNIPILVTNQVTTKFQSNLPAPHKGVPHQPTAERDFSRDGEAFLTAALGPAWSHCVNTRVVLEQNPQTRILTIAKSPIAPVTQIQFEITAGGIKLTSDARAADENFWTTKIHTVPTSIPEHNGDPCNQIFQDATQPEWQD